MKHQTPIADPDDALAEAGAQHAIALLSEQPADDAELAEQIGDAVVVGPDPTDRELLTVAQVARKYGVLSWAQHAAIPASP